MGSCHRQNAVFACAIGELRSLIGPEQIPCYARALHLHLHLHLGRCVSPKRAKVRREAFHRRRFQCRISDARPDRQRYRRNITGWRRCWVDRLRQGGRRQPRLARYPSTPLPRHRFANKPSGGQLSSQPPQALLILHRGRGVDVRATP